LLKKLNVGFNGCNVTKEGMFHFKEVFKALKSLKELRIDFSNNGSFCNEALENLCNGIKDVTTVEVFSIDLSTTKISGDGLKYLEVGLSKQNNLNTFRGCFYNTQITNESLAGIRDTIKALSNLEKIDFSFYHVTKLTDKGIEYLKDGLKMLPKLSCFRIMFAYCENLTNASLAYLKEAFYMSKTITHIELYLSNCKKLTDNGMISLAEMLKNLKSLTILELDFTNVEKLTDDGIQTLSNFLKNLSTLKTFTLNVSFCKKIGDRTLDCIEKSLKDLANLTRLTLNMSSTDITDKGTVSLKNLIKQLVLLSDLYLYLGICPKLTDNALKNIRDSLAGLMNLESLAIHLSGNKKIQDETFNKFKALFSNLKYTHYIK
jgi:Mn-dependent DtxR family transcriptional regulator